MSNLSVKEIKSIGREIVLSHPGGVRFKDIVSQIMAQHSNAVRNTVEAQIANALVPVTGSLSSVHPL